MSDDLARINSPSSGHAIIYLPNTELFAAKKFHTLKFLRVELNSSCQGAIKCEKVVAKSSLITIIALPRKSDDCRKKKLKVIALFPKSFERFFALIIFSHGPETNRTKSRTRQAPLICIEATPGNLRRAP